MLSQALQSRRARLEGNGFSTVWSAMPRIHTVAES